MDWMNTRWKTGLYNAGLTLLINLAIRAIWWSDEPLLSWNVPLSLILGFLVGCALWPFQRRYLDHRARYLKMKKDRDTILAEIDKFLEHPETGIQIERPKRGDK